MARKHLILTVVAGLTVATAAYAEYPVIDTTAIGKAMEQIKELKKQYQAELNQLSELKQSVSFLNDISGFMSEVQDAVGQVSNLNSYLFSMHKMLHNFFCPSSHPASGIGRLK